MRASRLGAFAARSVPVLAAVVTLAALASVARTSPARADDRPTTLLTIRDRRVTESSGLAPSIRHPGVLYTHNDSGDRPRVYAIGPDGETRAALTLAGASARDWEAVAVGRDDAGRPAIFLGDIGDNLHGAWPSVTVYRVTEPATLRDATVRAVRYRFRYADGARDAEALLIDPRSNRLYVASKESDKGGLYRAPAKLRTDQVNVLRRVGDVPESITDGAFSPDGGRFVLRDYFDAHVYAAPGRKLGTFQLPLQYQGESIAWTSDGGALLAGSEGAGSDVLRVPLPEELAPPPRSTAAGGGGSGSQAAGARPGAAPPEPGWDPGPILVASVAAAILVVLLLTARRRRRRAGPGRRAGADPPQRRAW
jgi:hypothetical protein